MKTLASYGTLIARILLALLFIVAGYNKIGGFEGTQAFIATGGFPDAPYMVLLVILVELWGWLLLLLGLKTRYAALSLILFVLITTVFFHNIITDPSQMTQFLKNMAIVGGLIQFAISETGIYAIDNKLK